MTAHFGIHDFGMVHNELNNYGNNKKMNERTSNKHTCIIGVLAVKRCSKGPYTRSNKFAQQRFVLYNKSWEGGGSSLPTSYTHNGDDTP